jgi:hypothetical protein
MRIRVDGLKRCHYELLIATYFPVPEALFH